jgi:hypothetical protein
MRAWTLSALCFFLLTLAAPSPAQQASYTTFGRGCGGEMGEIPPGVPPRIFPQGLPVVGTTFVVRYDSPRFQRSQGCWHQIVGTFVMGVSNQSLYGVPLPVPVPPVVWLGAANCMFYCSVEFIAGVGINDSGYAITIPNAPSLIGLTLYNQWYLWNYVSCTELFWYWTFTNGGAMTIGF